MLDLARSLCGLRTGVEESGREREVQPGNEKRRAKERKQKTNFVRDFFLNGGGGRRDSFVGRGGESCGGFGVLGVLRKKEEREKV